MPSNTPETQAILPVTKKARELAASYGRATYTISSREADRIKAGDWDNLACVQWFAGFLTVSQSHSLPGDVRKALEPFAKAYDEAKADQEHGATNSAPQKYVRLSDFRRAADALAALTPSAVSGDAGEGERDRLVALWHDTDVGNVITLPALLGMTDEQYSAWVRDPSNAALTTPPTPDRIGKDAVREALPKRCDGIEQPAFEEWAKAQGFDMTEHPLHYLFLDAKTDAARQAWCAGIKHASDRIAALSATPAQPVDETERLPSDAGNRNIATAREAAATYWDRKDVKALAKAIREGGCDDTMEVQVAVIALESMPQNYTGARK